MKSLALIGAFGALLGSGFPSIAFGGQTSAISPAMVHSSAANPSHVLDGQDRVHAQNGPAIPQNGVAIQRVGDGDTGFGDRPGRWKSSEATSDAQDGR